FAENPSGGMADVERAHQVHLDDGLEGFHAHLVEDHVAQDAGIVDDAVEAAEMVGRRLDDLACRDRFGHRLEVGHGNPAALLDLRAPFPGRRRRVARAVGGPAGIVDHNLGAFGGAEQRDLAPDAAACAGYDDDLVLQRFCHWVLLYLSFAVIPGRSAATSPESILPARLALGPFAQTKEAKRASF